MTFDVAERSNYDGMPVVLFEFMMGTTYWRYSSDETDYPVGDTVYVAAAVSCDEIRLSGEPTDDTLTVRIDASVPIANMLNGAPPSQTIWLNLRRCHHGETDAPIIWSGYVAGRKQVDQASVELSCKILTAGFAREGTRLAFGRQCPHVLYNADCGVNKALHAVSFQIDAVTGASISASELDDFADGYFAYGFMEWSRFAGTIERRAIETHVGSTITLIGSGVGLAVGTWVTVYPGCKRTRSECNVKFNNLSNYGGFAHLPGKSPFMGDPVF